MLSGWSTPSQKRSSRSWGVIRFFTIVEANPSGMEVATWVPKVPKTGTVAVAILPLLEVRRKPGYVRVGIEDSDGTAQGDFHILSADGFTRDDLSKAYVWESKLDSDGIVYDFSVPFDKRQKHADCQAIAAKLASASMDVPYSHSGADEDATRQLEVLERMHRRGLVQRNQASPTDAFWWLTEHGHRQLRLTQHLRHPKKLSAYVLSESKKIALANKSVFTLLHLLEDEGWTCAVKARRLRTKRELAAGDDVLLTPVD